jgi:hypothetical protein
MIERRRVDFRYVIVRLGFQSYSTKDGWAYGRFPHGMKENTKKLSLYILHDFSTTRNAEGVIYCELLFKS